MTEIISPETARTMTAERIRKVMSDQFVADINDKIVKTCENGGSCCAIKTLQYGYESGIQVEFVVNYLRSLGYNATYGYTMGNDNGHGYTIYIRWDGDGSLWTN